MNYVPLNIKTHYSLLSSMIKIEDLVIFANKNNLKQLTITDNNMYGVVEFYKLCISNNIKPIVGLEVKINELKVILYCMNYDGYKNLIKINTINLEEKLTIKELKIYCDNLICVIPYESLDIYNDLKKIFQYTFQSYKTIDERNKLSGSNLVYMDEILYLLKEDRTYINYLFAIRDGVFISEVNNVQDNYLKMVNEIEKQFPEDLKNNLFIK